MKKLIIFFICGFGIIIIPLIAFISFFSSSGDATNFEPTTPQDQVAIEVFNFVKDQGGTIEFVSAWLGNMEHESGLMPDRIQSDLPYNEEWAFNPIIGGYAMGLGQWDSGRRVNLLKFAKEQSKDWGTTEIQMEFAWNHDGSDSELLKKMSKGTDVDSLAVDILKKWERAGTKDDLVEQVNRKTSANNWYKRLSTGSLGGGSNIEGGKIDVLENVLGQTINGGQCYGLTAYYVDKLGGPKLMGSGFMYAEKIGSDYAWSKFGWEVIFDPKPSEIKAGDVINWYAGQNISPGIYGHTGIIASVDGEGKYTIYEQNSEQGQICAKYSRQWDVQFNKVASIVRKK